MMVRGFRVGLVLRRVLLGAMAAVLVVLLGAVAAPMRAVAAQNTTATLQAPHLWVLESVDQFRAPAPPDAAATAQEVTEMLALVFERDEAVLAQIAYWNSGPAAYRWNQIALDMAAERALPAPVGFRQMALLHAAIADATVAAWDSKLAYARPRPSEVDASLSTVIPNPASPSYPSEYAVTAGAAAAVLSWLYPDRAASFESLVQEVVNTRLLAGVEYPSDVEAGLEMGRQVAALVIARGDADGFSTAWEGTVPTGDGMWTGENPAFADAATWQTWALESPDQYRPDAPPAYDSQQMATEMAELRAFERTPVTNAIALFWEYGAGGRHIYWYWNDVANHLILSSDVADDPVAAARAYALTNIAGYDGMVACWDAKFTYWQMRPFQIDPEFAPLFVTPNHPGYPSAHSCMSTAAATVLAHLFPADAARLMAMVDEVAAARIWGGIHFRSDVEAGTTLGANVGEATLAVAFGSR
jgi:membrane-associated phospholipid phosphatase